MLNITALTSMNVFYKTEKYFVTELIASNLYYSRYYWIDWMDSLSCG